MGKTTAGAGEATGGTNDPAAPPAGAGAGPAAAGADAVPGGVTDAAAPPVSVAAGGGPKIVVAGVGGPGGIPASSCSNAACNCTSPKGGTPVATEAALREAGVGMSVQSPK